MNLILTFDYELFGDGTGNIFTHMIEPTDTILAVCDTYGIKTTIFFEVLEYIRLKEEWNKGNHMGYTDNPIKAIERQIQGAASAGHDIQLHIHPQWYDAAYENDKWYLNFAHWRLGGFSASNEYGVRELISECKMELEALITPVVPEYQCTAVRAGGYNIMPSDEVYRAMRQTGLIIDSSIYPGGYEVGTLSNYDYRDVSEEFDYWWANEKDLRQSSEKTSGVVEIPIFALPVPRWKRLLTLSKAKALLSREKAAISSVAREKVANKSVFQKIKFVLGEEATTWDVCMFPKSLHRRYFDHIEKKSLDKRKSFVLIGHPKSLKDEDLFKDFLSMAGSRKHKYSFTTLKAYYESIV